MTNRSNGEHVLHLIRREGKGLINKILTGPSGTPYVVIKILNEGVKVVPLPYNTGMPQEDLVIPNSTKVLIPDQDTLISRYRGRYEIIIGVKTTKPVHLIKHSLSMNGKEET